MQKKKTRTGLPEHEVEYPVFESLDEAIEKLGMHEVLRCVNEVNMYLAYRWARVNARQANDGKT